MPSNIKRSTIISKLSIDARFLDSAILKHVLNQLRKCMEGSCSKENGYIMNIYDRIDVLDNCISNANSDIIFTVRYEADILLPQKDVIYEGDVCMVFNKGIFIVVETKLKILVVVDALKGYTFDQLKSAFVSLDSSKKNIEKNDKTRVKITGVMYSKNKFSCYGEIVI